MLLENISSIDMLCKEGMDLYRNGEYKKAIKCFSKIMKLDPGNVEILSKKAYLLYYTGRFEEAIECYDRIIELVPNTPGAIKAWRSKGYIFFLQGNYGEVVNCYDKVLEFFPSDSFIKLQKEKVLKISGKSKGHKKDLVFLLKEKFGNYFEEIEGVQEIESQK